MDRQQEMERELDALRRRVAELQGDDQREVQRRRLMSVFDAMFEGIQIISYDYRYLYLNKPALQHSQYDLDALVGKRMADVYPGIEETEMFGQLRECMTRRAPRQLLNLFTFPSGDEGWFDLRFTPVPAGVLILSIDVTEQHEAEEESQRREEDLATTLECMTEGIISTDLQGRVVRINPAAEALTGWSKAEAEGHLLDELIQVLDGTTMEAIYQPIGRMIREELRMGIDRNIVLVRRDGSRCQIECSSAPLRNAEGAPRGVVVALRDTTEEFMLNAMLQQAQKMEAVGNLAGGIAHDFNNYLTVISGYCQLVEESVADDEALLDDLRQIREAADKAASLTQQLLAFSRQKVLRPEVINLADVIEGTEKMLRRLIGENIELSVHLEPDVYPVKFDPSQIEQIIMNLAVNARDAMPDGGSVSINARNVYLDSDYASLHKDAQEGPHVMIAVADTGTGMPSEVRERIFEPFYTTKPHGKGTGLGLSTVYGIVKQSGGNIWVYSEMGHGTTFKIYLPRAEGDAVADEPRPSIDLTAGSETILVVEDDEAVRSLIVRLLRDSGYEVLDMPGPADALECLDEYAGEIHLLLTDVVMPNMDGVQLATLARDLRPEMKVVFMSGYTDDAVVHRGMIEPGTAFVEKPVTRDVLLETIRAFL